jgi:ankyrin repeat protein
MAEYPEIVQAVWGNDLRALEQLSSDPDVIDPDGRTALQAAAIDSKIDAAKILLKAGAAVNFQDPSGWTALHFAAQSGSVEFASLLIDHGAVVETRDSHGNNPLFRAMFGGEHARPLIELLCANGANPESKNEAGVSAVDLAETMGDADLAQYYANLD